MTRKLPHAPPHVRGLRPGDKVVTQLGRVATIKAIRLDGYLDATYDDWPSSLAEVILQADHLRRVQ